MKFHIAFHDPGMEDNSRIPVEKTTTCHFLDIQTSDAISNFRLFPTSATSALSEQS